MQFRSTERVERDGYLVYAEGDEIPASDVDELVRQGHIARKAGDDTTVESAAVEVVVAAPVAVDDGLDTLSKDELYTRATELDIDGRSKMSKDELAAAIRSIGA